MTKQEELKVLEKIQKLIAETGEGSYISMAFWGVCDVARENIEYDWGFSPVNDLEEYKARYAEAESRAKALDKELEDERSRLSEDIDAIHKRLSDKSEALLEFRDEMTEFHQEMATYIDEAVKFYRSGQKRHEEYGKTDAAAFKRGAADALEDFKGLFFE